MLSRNMFISSVFVLLISTTGFLAFNAKSRTLQTLSFGLISSSPSALSSSSKSVETASSDGENAGMNQISNLYDYYIIDQWGVLHDGKTPYPGVLQCLENLKREGKCLILLSNSSKRKSNSFKGLSKVGINPSLFDDIVTSGEMAWNAIKQRRFDFTLPAPISEDRLRVFLVGNNDDDAEYIESCNCVVSPPETADFVLARGTFRIATGSDPDSVLSYTNAEDLIADIDPYLARCKSRGLPMLVSNPDNYRPGSGAPMPGQIGRKYSDMNGIVQYIGKPCAAVYNECMSVLSRSSVTASLSSDGTVDKSRVCGVGDSLDHDILGAKTAGIASIWTANGVHSAEMGTTEGCAVIAEDSLLEEMYVKYDVRPTHSISSFKW
jgi:HAD superfamily hydrolase (TIGR01459 family)